MLVLQPSTILTPSDRWTLVDLDSYLSNTLTTAKTHLGPFMLADRLGLHLLSQLVAFGCLSHEMQGQ